MLGVGTGELVATNENRRIEERIEERRYEELHHRVVCKEVYFQNDCNTCHHTLCNDGVRQWVDSGDTCTVAYCGHIYNTPYNPSDWR